MVLLPAYMAEENTANGGVLRFPGAPWPVADGVDGTALPQLEALYAGDPAAAVGAARWSIPQL